MWNCITVSSRNLCNELKVLLKPSPNDEVEHKKLISQFGNNIIIYLLKFILKIRNSYLNKTKNLKQLLINFY